MAATKIRWGDTLDEDDSLPANSISGPDGRGVKTIVEYKRNDKGEAIKVTTKTRVSKVEKKVYKARAAQPASQTCSAATTSQRPHRGGRAALGACPCCARSCYTRKPDLQRGGHLPAPGPSRPSHSGSRRVLPMLVSGAQAGTAVAPKPCRRLAWLAGRGRRPQDVSPDRAVGTATARRRDAVLRGGRAQVTAERRKWKRFGEAAKEQVRAPPLRPASAGQPARLQRAPRPAPPSLPSQAHAEPSWPELLQRKLFSVHSSSTGCLAPARPQDHLQPSGATPAPRAQRTPPAHPQPRARPGAARGRARSGAACRSATA